jgi:hypothetical protein
MQIPFSSIKREKKEIEFLFVQDNDKLNIKGFIFKDRFVNLHLSLKGKIEVDCTICAEPFLIEINEEIKLKVSDKIVKNSEFDSLNESYDIIESLDCKIDFEEIIRGEINIIKLDYFKCKKCQEKDKKEK